MTNNDRELMEKWAPIPGFGFDKWELIETDVGPSWRGYDRIDSSVRIIVAAYLREMLESSCDVRGPLWLCRLRNAFRMPVNTDGASWKWKGNRLAWKLLRLDGSSELFSREYVETIRNLVRSNEPALSKRIAVARAFGMIRHCETCGTENDAVTCPPGHPDLREVFPDPHLLPGEVGIRPWPLPVPDDDRAWWLGDDDDVKHPSWTGSVRPSCHSRCCAAVPDHQCSSEYVNKQRLMRACIFEPGPTRCETCGTEGDAVSCPPRHPDLREVFCCDRLRPWPIPRGPYTKFEIKDERLVAYQKDGYSQIVPADALRDPDSKTRWAHPRNAKLQMALFQPPEVPEPDRAVTRTYGLTAPRYWAPED